jgi:hypothetical protein
MYYLLPSLTIALCCAVISIVYMCVLSREPILNWWFRFGMRFERRAFHKPIWGCEKCFAGQLALWSSLLFHSDGQELHTGTFFLSACTYSSDCFHGLILAYFHH